MTEMCMQHTKTKSKQDSLGPTKQRVFQFVFFHPDFSLKECSRALGMSHDNVRQAWHRLKKRHNIFKLCPVCFTENFDGTVCHACGFELGQTQSVELSQTGSPVTDFSYNGLGNLVRISDLKHPPDGKGLHFTNQIPYLQHILDNGIRGNKRERKLERLRSLLTEQLKSFRVTDQARVFADRILVQEFRRFETDYPELLSKHGVDQSIVKNTIKHLRPWLNEV